MNKQVRIFIIIITKIRKDKLKEKFRMKQWKYKIKLKDLLQMMIYRKDEGSYRKKPNKEKKHLINLKKKRSKRESSKNNKK